MGNPFQPAVRAGVWARIAICGPSGAGKTYTGLLLAAGLAGGGGIAVIDTEHGRALLHAQKPGLPEFDHVQLDPPFTPERFVDLMRAAANGGYRVLMIDSLSHAWIGQSALREQADKLRQEGGNRNQISPWMTITPKQNRFIDELMRVPMHLICTLRATTEWSMEKDENGRQKPVKVGLRPEQRKGLEYEFMLFLDVEHGTNIVTPSKDTTGLFHGTRFVATREHGEVLRRWIESGHDPAAEQAQKLDELCEQWEAYLADSPTLEDLAGRLGDAVASLREAGAGKEHAARIAAVKDRRKAELQAQAEAAPAEGEAAPEAEPATPEDAPSTSTDDWDAQYDQAAQEREQRLPLTGGGSRRSTRRTAATTASGPDPNDDIPFG